MGSPDQWLWDKPLAPLLSYRDPNRDDPGGQTVIGTELAHRYSITTRKAATAVAPGQAATAAHTRGV